jgi:hypothetical protein
MTTLLEPAIFFAGIAALAYFEFQRQYDKEADKITEKRKTKARAKLNELLSAQRKKTEITQEIEDKIQDLIYGDYSNINEVRDLVDDSVRYFLFSMVVLFIAVFLDTTTDIFILSYSAINTIFSIEILAFMVGIALLGMGVFFGARLRRVVRNEPDLDPPPFATSIILVLLAALNSLILFELGSTYSTLTTLGLALFYGLFLTYPGVILAMITWEEEDWRRILGTALIVIPYLSIFVVPFVLYLSGHF